MVCRNRQRGAAALQRVIDETNNENVQIIYGDCGLRADVERIVAEFTQKERSLNALVCNAGG